MGNKERFCHNCGIKIDWNVQLLLDKPFVEADNFLLLKQILSEVNKKNEGIIRMKCNECNNANICLDHIELPSLIGCTSGIPDHKSTHQR